MAKRSLISDVNLFLVRSALDSSWNRGPSASVEDLWEMYFSIAETGQISVPEHPILRVTPVRKGSVLETLRLTFMYFGLPCGGKNVMSLHDRWSLGLNVPGQVNSLILRNPKKVSVKAAQSISLCVEGLESRSWKSFRCVSVMGS